MGDWKNMQKFRILLISILILISLGVLFFLADKEIRNKEESGFTYQISRLIPESVKDFLKETLFAKSALESKIEVLEKEKLLTAQENITLYTNISQILRSSSVSNISAPLQSEENIEELVNVKKFKIDFLSNGKSLFSKASAYLETIDENVLIVSADGVVGYFNISQLETNKLSITSIPTNIESFIDYAEFYTQSFLGIKDVLVNDGNVYVSYTKQLEEDCFNISILKAKVDYKELIFNDFFSVDECTTRTSIYDDNMHHAGGRIISLNDTFLVLTVGDFGNYEAVQDDDSYFGKIIKINIDTKNYSIISKGHRNPQGLALDVVSNTIISTEHGPYGGDEINLIDLGTSEPENFGWPVSSYGEHNSLGRVEINSSLYDRAPLNKSHIDYGFKEPAKFYVPSIGISEVIFAPENTLFNDNERRIIVSSMGYTHEGFDLDDFTLHIFKGDYKNGLQQDVKIRIGERIRDIKYVKSIGKYIMFLENSPAIALLSKKELLEDKITNLISRSGKEIYLRYCAACHTNGFAGSPLLKDEAEWDLRLSYRGREQLIYNAFYGYKAMPAKGGCGDCSYEEIEKSVDYMLNFKDPGPTGG